MTSRANDGVPRRPSRLGSLTHPALLLAFSAFALATAFVTCEPPPPSPPDVVEDAGPLDAGRDAGFADVLPDDDTPDAYDGPVLGDPCSDSLDCAPPQMICCANVCLEPHLCM